MPITPDPPFPKTQGDNIRSKDWNDTVNEVIRLDNAKLNLTGGRITGPLNVDGPLGIGTQTPNRSLTIQGSAGTFLNVRALTGGPFEILLGADSAGGILSVMTNHDLQIRAGNNTTRMIVKAGGNVGIGTLTPGAPLHVADHMCVGPFAATTGAGGLDLTGPVAELGLVRRSLTAYPATPAAGDRFVWYNPDGSARLFTEVNGDLLSVAANGELRLERGSLSIPRSGGGVATFSNVAPNNEGTFVSPNLKLSMGFLGLSLPGSPPFVYQFMIGHFNFFGAFNRVFSVDQAGNAFFAGGKGGYVVDYFVNAVGDKVERGDVVVIAGGKAKLRYGSQNNIPIPEVDLCSKDYDTRVCGIVADFVPENDLPSVDPPPDADAKFFQRHTFAGMGGPPDQNPAQVLDRQFGRMVTLGSYAHCKVDTTGGPIKTGDLLTTSKTPGHARKVDDPAQAVGAIIGKALAPLARGKGVIPILVMLQ